MIRTAIEHYLQKQQQERISPKAVLFDMDGVLFDSMVFHARAWQEIAEKHHLRSVPEDFFLFEGMTGGNTINELFLRTRQREATAEEKESIYNEKAALFNQYNDGEPMPGALEVLEKVKAFELKRVLVTGSGQRSLLEKLEHTYPGFFEKERMVTSYDVRFGKPHPEPYLIGLEKGGVQPHEAIVVENAPMGVQSAVAAHIFTIAVNTGPLADQVLLDAGANLLYPDMNALAKDWEAIMTAFSEI
ncbi:HAD-IA family hydrolase [Parabacteroides sp. PF5-9]|uniref:HAD family hydrolase n=1 Tax=Parabacteroides sp. PF5-9 TaxID=1742404 RepID=UPI002474DAA9|nr:HAD-IA family hydrolase [Parabacteroides sp. PF5-9]MDH6357192.1 HAD superfamily hydrolase (TIGR01509 family) [Parabacteroides sp. PF5-9]